MRPAARDIGDVRAASVDRAPRVDDGRSGGHLRVRDLLGRGRRTGHLLGGRELAVGPAMTPGHDARRAVFAREIDERDHRRELELGMRARHVAPDHLVPVQPLLLGAGPALEQVTDVQLVARARRQQDPIAERVDGRPLRLREEPAARAGIRPPDVAERHGHRAERKEQGLQELASSEEDGGRRPGRVPAQLGQRIRLL